MAISSAYYVNNRTAADAASKFSVQLGIDMAGNILKEFWPDIHRKFSRTHNLRVCQEAEECHLGESAETDRTGIRIEPLAGNHVMFVPVRGGGDPDVNVGKTNAVSRECHRSQYSSANATNPDG